MSYRFNREQLGQGVHLCSIQDTKFKHNRISINMIMPLDQESATNNAVVPYILRKGYRECPDFTKLNEKLENLYGASLDANIEKLGNLQVMTVSIYGIDSRFALGGEDMVKECASLLCSIVLDPHFINGVFSQDDVKSEKQYLINTIQTEINDKRSYALQQCIQTMCKGEQIAIKKYGYLDDAKAITPQSATQAYENLIKHAQIEIMVVGAGESASAKEVFSKAFGSMKRTPVELGRVEKKTARAEVCSVEETMDVNQAKLVMGYRSGDISDLVELSNMRVMVALFGGTAFSLLFSNVREKLSLCYYCAARYDRTTGIMTVDSGVESHNRQKAQEEIIRQLEVVKAGDFDESLLENTKLALVTALNYTPDSLGGLEGWYLSQILQGTNTSPEEEIQRVERVTKEDVVQAAKRLELDTVYFLTGEEVQK